VDPKIQEHLQRLHRYLLMLQDAGKAPLDVFIHDALLSASTERYLQLAIESCLNIGNRLLSLVQFDKPVKAPDSYAAIFKELETLGILDEALTQRLVRMAKFRNRLVHLYWDVDPTAVHGILRENLGDFSAFSEKVVEYFNSMRLPPH
jgi:uncharacterized protein YutE (UPF0331/DUF86 family)